MSRSVFISDIDTPLGEGLVKQYINADNRVFATVSADRADQALELEGLTVERWNRNSPISAKNMFLKACTVLDNLDEVLLLGNPALSLPLPPIHQAGYDLINREVDCWIKGNLFLLKSVLSMYTERKSGILALICLNPGNPSSPLEETIKHSFVGLARSLLDIYGNMGFRILGFESSTGQVSGFSEFIYKYLSESRTSGRWLRYKSGLLSNLKYGAKQLTAQ